MAKYADLHIVPKVDDEASCKVMASLLREVGYTNVALTVPSGVLKTRAAVVRRIFEDAGLVAALRIDLAPRSRTELLNLLRRFRRFYDIVSVKCVNSAVAGVASRDRRVDIIFFDPSVAGVRFSYTLAGLLSGALELNLVSVLVGQGRPYAFSRAVNEALIASQARVKVVVSSGAASPFMVRAPSQSIALAKAVGLADDLSTNGVSRVPLSILELNLAKLSREYMEEGVNVVKVGQR